MYNNTFFEGLGLGRHGITLQPHVIEQRPLIIASEELIVQLDVCREGTSAQSAQSHSFWVTAEERCIVLNPFEGTSLVLHF